MIKTITSILRMSTMIGAFMDIFIAIQYHSQGDINEAIYFVLLAIFFFLVASLNQDD